MSVELLEQPMAKKKSASKKPSDAEVDQHLSGFMIRLPEEYREPLQRIKKTLGRAMTITIQMALEEHFRKIGVDFTQNWSENL